MCSDLIPSPQACVCRRREGWLIRTERFLSTTCMGWCLGASYNEDPKATAIAYAGGASSVFLANFLVNRHASQHGSQILLGAGGLLSVAGIAWGMHVAIDEHPKAAIRTCLAGALSVCLAKSLVLSDPPATVTKPVDPSKGLRPAGRPGRPEISNNNKSVGPNKGIRPTGRPGRPKNSNNNECELYKGCVDFPVILQKQIEQIGKDLKRLSKEYRKSNVEKTVNEILTDPLKYLFKTE